MVLKSPPPPPYATLVRFGMFWFYISLDSLLISSVHLVCIVGDPHLEKELIYVLFARRRSGGLTELCTGFFIHARKTGYEYETCPVSGGASTTRPTKTRHKK